MYTSAGVALGRVAGGAPFSLTLVSGNEVNQPILAETTTHILSEDSPDSIIKYIADLTGNADLAIALPTCVPGERMSAFRRINTKAMSQLLAFIALNHFE